MEIERATRLLSAFAQLPFQGFAIDADAHRREFESATEHVIPHQQIAVQTGQTERRGRGIVVVVGGTQIVRLTVAERTADADDEHGALLAHDGIFTLLGGERGIKLAQRFGVDEGNLFGQLRLQLRETLAHQIFGALHGGIDRTNHFLEEFHGAIFGANHALPVPLVDIERMQVAQLLVCANSVHVGINAVAGLHIVFGEGETLPLGQRVDHFGPGIAQILDGEIHSALFAAEVVVDAQTAQHKQRSRDATEAKRGGKVIGKELFDDFNALLGGVHVEQRTIVTKGNEITHERGRINRAKGATGNGQMIDNRHIAKPSPRNLLSNRLQK